MNKLASPKSAQPKKGNKDTVIIHGRDGKITAFLSNANDVVERYVTKAFTGQRQSSVKPRVLRAPHLSNVERELNELRKIVDALAVRSVAQDHAEASIDMEGMTVLDADLAYQMLENPTEPNEVLRNILALR